MTTQKLESISELQNFLQAIYGEKNNKQSFEYIYSFASHNCAYLARSIEKNASSDPYFISSFSWICALGSYLDINLEKAFYKKFPNCCPYCLERVCICLSSGKTSLKFKNQRAAKAERENLYRTVCQSKQDLSKTAKTLNSIYPSNRAVWSIHSHHYQFSRLFEELGEIYEAYCLYKTNGEKYLLAISEEIADCIAWLLSAWDIKNPDTPFTDAFLSYYSQDCPACIKSPCECKDHYAKNKSLHSEQDLNRLLESLGNLSKALKLDSPKSASISSALELIEMATKELQESTKDTTSDIKAAINRNDNYLSKAKEMILKTPELAEKFNNLFAAYETIKNNLPWV